MVDINTLTGSNTDAYAKVANYLGVSVTVVLIAVLVLSIWALIWKGFALWKAANKRSLIWFIALLIINTFGILEILYIFILSKMNFRKKDKVEVAVKKKR